MEKGLNNQLNNVINMGAKDIIPTYIVILLGIFVGLIITLLIGVVFFLKGMPVNKTNIIYLTILIPFIGGLIGFGLAFSSKNGN